MLITQPNTRMGFYLEKRFCKLFSESCTVVLQLPCWPSKQGELSNFFFTKPLLQITVLPTSTLVSGVEASHQRKGQSQHWLDLQVVAASSQFRTHTWTLSVDVVVREFKRGKFVFDWHGGRKERVELLLLSTPPFPPSCLPSHFCPGSLNNHWLGIIKHWKITKLSNFVVVVQLIPGLMWADIRCTTTKNQA